jgi:hypothetical protein
VTAVVVIEAVAIALLGLLVAGLLRSHAEILRQLHALGVGMDHTPTDGGKLELANGVAAPRESANPAFDLAGETPGGDAVAMSIVGSAENTLLAFLSAGCLTCAGFWKDFQKPQDLGLPSGVKLVVVTKAASDESLSQVRRLTPGQVPVVMSTAAWNDYGVPGAPYFILVGGPSGLVVGEGSSSSWSEVRGLMTQAVADSDAASARNRLGTSDRVRRDRADAELMAAGITAGHPSLSGTARPLHGPQTPPESS